MGHPGVPADGCDVRQTEDDTRTLEQSAGAGAAAARQRAIGPMTYCMITARKLTIWP